MVIQREKYKIIMPKEWEQRIKENCCPVCNKPKKDWSRRTDWTNCSTECTDKYNKKVIYGWSQLRRMVFNRDNRKCVKCGGVAAVADHIIPIAIGGKQWDIDNIQTLCMQCDKIKTKEDQKNIGIQRRKEKLELKGQQTLINNNI